MPKPSFLQIANNLRECAKRLDDAKRLAAKQHHLAIQIQVQATTAARLLIEAIDKGAFPKSREKENGGWWNRAEGRIPGMHWFAYEGNVPAWKEGDEHWCEDYQERCAMPPTIKQLVGMWPHVVGWLTGAFPTRFRDEPNAWFWWRAAEGPDGKPLDKTGRPITSGYYKDGVRIGDASELPDDMGEVMKLMAREGYELKLDAQIAGVTDFYDGVDALEHQRARAEVSSDACRLMAELIEAAGGKGDGSKPEAQIGKPTVAMAILMQVPEIAVAELAKQVGVSAGTLYSKSKKWDGVRKTLLARGDAVRGERDSEGRIEAWDDSRKSGANESEE